jgi:hypothetical protein
VIEVGNLAGIGTGRRVGLGCFFNQASHRLAGQVVRVVVEVAAVGVAGELLFRHPQGM